MLFGPAPLIIAFVLMAVLMLRAIYLSVIQGSPKDKGQAKSKFGCSPSERVGSLAMIVGIATLIAMEKTQSIEYKPHSYSIHDGGDYVAVNVKDQPTIILQTEDEMKLARESKFIYRVNVWKFMGTAPNTGWTFVKPDSDLAKEVK